MVSFDGLINSLVFWLSSLSLGLSGNGTHSLEYKVPYRNRPGRTEVWSSRNGGRFPECCSKRDSMEETRSLVFTMSVWICCNLGGLLLGKCKRSRWREGEEECWHHFLRHERSNQFENKQLRKISSLLRRCRYSWKRKEKAKKKYGKDSLTCRGFEAQQKKMQRIMGPCACAEAPWDNVICFLTCPRSGQAFTCV